MIQSVNKYQISQLFNVEAGVAYVIPRYQREYSWKEHHWEHLFDDIEENDTGYFLGSIICINQTKDAHTVQKLELVDGQQRLITISLLFAAIYSTLKNQDKDNDKLYELTNLKLKIVLEKEGEKIRLTPQIQNNNLNDYQAVLGEAGIINKKEVLPYAVSRKIFRAYKYFMKRISLMITDKENKVKAILDYFEKVNQACLVKIEVASHADAYTLFESLNNRGMPLTAIDLIKNKLLAEVASTESDEQVDRYFDQWTCLLGHLGDDYSIQERFFRQYYNAFKDELKSAYNVPVATRSNMIKIFEALINENATEFMQKVIEAGRLYSVIILRCQDDTFQDIEKPFIDLFRIQGAPSYLLMLYLLVRKNELQLTNEHFESILKLLTRFFVRRNLTDTPPTRDLTRQFMALIDKIRSLRGDDVYMAIEDQLADVSSSDEIFQQRLSGSVYYENSWATRFILCALVEESMTRETWVDLWHFTKNQFVWTIEHIWPQGDKIPQVWVDMMTNGDEDKAWELQQTHVHKLGNLTISGFNSALGNKSFTDKRDRTDKKGRPVGYNNGLKLNEDLATATGWSIEQIEARTEKLVAQALSLFKLRRN